jgi:hypothetical protein
LPGTCKKTTRQQTNVAERPGVSLSSPGTGADTPGRLLCVQDLDNFLRQKHTDDLAQQRNRNERKGDAAHAETKYMERKSAVTKKTRGHSISGLPADRLN